MHSAGRMSDESKRDFNAMQIFFLSSHKVDSMFSALSNQNTDVKRVYNWLLEIFFDLKWPNNCILEVTGYEILLKKKTIKKGE